MNQTSVAITATVVALGILGSTAVNAFLMTATPAYGAPTKDKVVVRGQGEGGFAEWSDINVEVPGAGTAVYADLFVAETAEGTDLSVFLTTEEGNHVQGFTRIDQNVFDANTRVTSATLSPVKIEALIFDESFINIIGTTEITVQATWEGTSDLLKEKFSIHTKSEDFNAKLRESTLSREATVKGSINGADLGTSDFADMYAFKQIEMRVSDTIIT